MSELNLSLRFPFRKSLCLSLHLVNERLKETTDPKVIETLNFVIKDLTRQDAFQSAFGFGNDLECDCDCHVSHSADRM